MAPYILTSVEITQNERFMPVPSPSFTDIQDISLKAGLYLVATPIGNMRDITLRALDVLKAVDVVACEDTRVSGKFLAALGLKKKLMPYHDHNASVQRPQLLQIIREGKSVALISDAGMPLISDPGYKLVKDCLSDNIYVTSMPGANAPLMAVQLSGLPSDTFSFLGFLPQKTKARQDVLEKWRSVPSTLILFESASRVEDCCADILAVLGNRPVTLTRELTKMFEDIWVSDTEGILQRLRDHGPPKGEIVLVVGRGSEEHVSEEGLDNLLIKAMRLTSLKEAVADVAAATGLPKKQVYNRALELKDNAP